MSVLTSPQPSSVNFGVWALLDEMRAKGQEPDRWEYAVRSRLIETVKPFDENSGPTIGDA